MKAAVGSQEVVVSYEESSENDSAVGVFESAACASVELVGTVEAFDELLEGPVLSTFIVIIGESDDLETIDRFFIIFGVKPR